MRIILASGSPRRKELLKLVVPQYEVMISGAEEILKEGLNPQEQAMNLSYLKAKDIYEKNSGDRIVIGSDTMVVKNKKIYGKPKNRKHANEMIKELVKGDRTHSVITGLSVIIQKNGQYQEVNIFDEAKVYLKHITDEEIQKWLDTGKAMDKAGAYGIQNEFGVFVEKIDGNYTTVLGLPIHKLYDIIKDYIN